MSEKYIALSFREYQLSEDDPEDTLQVALTQKQVALISFSMILLLNTPIADEVVEDAMKLANEFSELIQAQKENES